MYLPGQRFMHYRCNSTYKVHVLAQNCCLITQVIGCMHWQSETYVRIYGFCLWLTLLFTSRLPLYPHIWCIPISCAHFTCYMQNTGKSTCMVFALTPSIHFRAPASRMDDGRQTGAKLLRYFHLLGCSPQKLQDLSSPNFTRYSGISGTIVSYTHKALVHSVSERQNN